jgi:hypothetical protein
MPRDAKASFKFTTRTLSAPRLLSTAVTNKLETVITLDIGSAVAYSSVSDVFSSPNMVLGAAADFGTQTDTPATGSTDLPGVFSDYELYAKIVVTVGSGALTNCGTPQFQIFGSDTSTVNATSFALSTGVAEISPAVNVTTTVSTSTIYYLPVKSTKKYWQFQLNGTATAAVATGATYTIKMAGLVTSRDGAQSL